jgi:DNA topoisomerase-2
VRFIMAVINGTLRVANRKKAEVEADLAAQGFDRLPSRDGKSKASLGTSTQACLPCR